MEIRSALEYQRMAIQTAKVAPTEEQLMASAFGLSGEAAELLCAVMNLVTHAGGFTEHMKKHVIHGHSLDKEKVVKEMGDVMWYLALAADTIDVTLPEIMGANIKKLRERYGDKFSSDASINRVEE